MASSSAGASGGEEMSLGECTMAHALSADCTWALSLSTESSPSGEETLGGSNIANAPRLALLSSKRSGGASVGEEKPLGKRAGES